MRGTQMNAEIANIYSDLWAYIAAMGGVMTLL
jgi:hypothetical protein